MGNPRMIKDWRPERAADSELAPHRYRWDNDSDLVDDDLPHREWWAAQPYDIGDVVMIAIDQRPVRARIVGRLREMNFYHEWRPRYRVQYETKAGLWSKLWRAAYPGDIQRGYYYAGLAPDIPEGHFSPKGGE